MTITRDELDEVISTYGKSHIANRMAVELLAAMDSEPVAWRVSFTQIGHESNNFTKTYWDEEEKDRWVKLHKMGGFKVNVDLLYTAAPVQATMDNEPVAWKWRLVDLVTGDPGEWRVTMTPKEPGKGVGYRTEVIPLYCRAAMLNQK